MKIFRSRGEPRDARYKTLGQVSEAIQHDTYANMGFVNQTLDFSFKLTEKECADLISQIQSKKPYHIFKMESKELICYLVNQINYQLNNSILEPLFDLLSILYLMCSYYHNENLDLDVTERLRKEAEKTTTVLEAQDLHRYLLRWQVLLRARNQPVLSGRLPKALSSMWHELVLVTVLPNPRQLIEHANLSELLYITAVLSYAQQFVNTSDDHSMLDTAKRVLEESYLSQTISSSSSSSDAKPLNISPQAFMDVAIIRWFGGLTLTLTRESSALQHADHVAWQGVYLALQEGNLSALLKHTEELNLLTLKDWQSSFVNRLEDSTDLNEDEPYHLRLFKQNIREFKQDWERKTDSEKQTIAEYLSENRFLLLRDFAFKCQHMSSEQEKKGIELLSMVIYKVFIASNPLLTNINAASLLELGNTVITHIVLSLISLDKVTFMEVERNLSKSQLKVIAAEFLENDYLILRKISEEFLAYVFEQFFRKSDIQFKILKENQEEEKILKIDVISIINSAVLLNDLESIQKLCFFIMHSNLNSVSKESVRSALSENEFLRLTLLAGFYETFEKKCELSVFLGSLFDEKGYEIPPTIKDTTILFAWLLHKMRQPETDQNKLEQWWLKTKKISKEAILDWFFQNNLELLRAASQLPCIGWLVNQFLSLQTKSNASFYSISLDIPTDYPQFIKAFLAYDIESYLIWGLMDANLAQFDHHYAYMDDDDISLIKKKLQEPYKKIRNKEKIIELLIENSDYQNAKTWVFGALYDNDSIGKEALWALGYQPLRFTLLEIGGGTWINRNPKWPVSRMKKWVESMSEDDIIELLKIISFDLELVLNAIAEHLISYYSHDYNNSYFRRFTTAINEYISYRDDHFEENDFFQEEKNLIIRGFKLVVQSSVFSSNQNIAELFTKIFSHFLNGSDLSNMFIRTLQEYYPKKQLVIEALFLEGQFRYHKICDESDMIIDAQDKLLNLLQSNPRDEGLAMLRLSEVLGLYTYHVVKPGIFWGKTEFPSVKEQLELRERVIVPFCSSRNGPVNRL